MGAVVFPANLRCRTGRQPGEPSLNRGLWGDGSGAGSGAAEADPYVRTINSLALVGGWKTAVDMGCGDGRVAHGLKFDRYVGMDCCPQVFPKTRGPGHVFLAGDILKDWRNLPDADVMLCKDVLHHLPNDLVQSFVRDMLTSGKWKWVVFTQDVHQQHDGQNCYMGGYRALNPNLEPLREFGFTTWMPYLHKAILIRQIA